MNTETNNITKLFESIYILEQSFDGIQVRGTLVLGTHNALLFDTLILPEQSAKIAPLCRDRELVVVYSHADWDHVWGTCGLSPVHVIAHEECAERFNDKADVEQTLNEYRLKHKESLAQVKLISPQQTFKTTLTLDLGGISVELRHCPGHTKDSILAIVPERSLLIGADCIETPIPLLNETAHHLPQWIEVLGELAQDARIKTCVPSHGEIQGKELINNNITYLKSLLSKTPINPTGLDDFYTEGHRDNLIKTAELRHGVPEYL